MPHNGETRKQVSVALSEVQTDWCNQQARKRGISTAEFIRRLIDGMMLGDNTMSRGVDWQQASAPGEFPLGVPIMDVPPIQSTPRGKSQYGELVSDLTRIGNITPDHRRWREYVEALRRGDADAAEKIRRG